MKIVILVHPGSVFVSAADQVSASLLDPAIDAMEDLIDISDGLIVIHGFLSEHMSRGDRSWVDDLMKAKSAAGQIAWNLWGCDDGSVPSDKFWPEKDIFEHQTDAARALHEWLPENAEITVTGAWACVDEPGALGCVNSVAQVLRKAGRTDVRIHEGAVMDAWIGDDDPSP